jgi:hypothetical protein
VGGGIATGVGIKALALTGAALAAPVLGAAMVLGLGAYVGSGALYRWEIGKTTSEIERALAAVDAAIRAFDIFGEAPPGRAPQGWQAGPQSYGVFVPME